MTKNFVSSSLDLLKSMRMSLPVAGPGSLAGVCMEQIKGTFGSLDG